jgi:hypothetical protein
VPKSLGKDLRTGPFGMINAPISVLKNGISDLLGEVRHQRCLVDSNPLRAYPVGKLRAQFYKTLVIESCTQPVGCKSENYRQRGGPRVHELEHKYVHNPIWDRAPRGTYYKARRLGSLATDVALYGFNRRSRLPRLLRRLAINVWRLSRKDFDGLCRSIRATMAQSAVSDSYFRKSPETLMHSGVLISNPQLRLSGKWRNPRQKSGCESGCASARLSKRFEVVRTALWCTTCTGPVCTGRWFTRRQK